MQHRQNSYNADLLPRLSISQLLLLAQNLVRGGKAEVFKKNMFGIGQILEKPLILRLLQPGAQGQAEAFFRPLVGGGLLVLRQNFF